jgi:benzylsuccinate CoA-transferase BbsF subunit
MINLPLRDIRIADFTWLGAGSFTTKIFADYGANVIKVESGERLDALRKSPPYKDGIEGVNRSGYFTDRNSSKRSLTLNLKTEEGRALGRQLIAESDVVANNFSPGVMEKFGLGYDDVRLFKPDIVYLSMSMQGQSGPEAEYLGYGLTMGALTGLQNASGYPYREPTGTGTNYPDHIPNPTHAAFALLAALRHRRRTGQGQQIDLAQVEPTICLLGASMVAYTANKDVGERCGNQHLASAPCGVYPCEGSDRWIAIVVTDNAQWLALCQVLGDDALARDPRWHDAPGRWQHRQPLEGRLRLLSREFDRDDLMHKLQAAGVSAGAVNDALDVLHHDAQLQHRAHWVRHAHPEMGLTTYSAVPFRLSRTPGGPQAPAPLLGQHTDDICANVLGLDQEAIAGLRERGALR